ncbi:LysR family transcriptional regulator [Gluconacetobacter tumulisoli]|uniref:LysR family transcriptional regulator n=1 Tax=Gluconacetobacter tumulisoli TaxID=1286189 RepID=A0A7W4K9Y1_9PROT|nr:LysR family transcriptional regulator [Gluconacetobacter tumulisoli]MBB2203058.1 LysR family transcriptional regulator [Gluconacetobacter tumulisoli]
MNMKFLEAFLAVSRFRSFRQAAEVCHISQAAISSRIAALEADLGCTLINRQGREFALTSAGRCLIPHAEALLQAREVMKQEVRAAGNGVRTVHIGAVGSLAGSILPRVSRQVASLASGLRLSVHTAESGEVVRMLRERRIDIAMARAGLSTRGFSAEPLCSFPMYWIGSAALAADGPSLFSKRKLACKPIVSYSPTSPGHQSILHYFGRERAADLRLNHADSLAMLVHLLRNGLGIAPIPAVAVLDELASSQLRILPTEEAFPTVHYELYVGDTRTSEDVMTLAALVRREVEAFCNELPDEHAVLS